MTRTSLARWVGLALVFGLWLGPAEAGKFSGKSYSSGGSSKPSSGGSARPSSGGSAKPSSGSSSSGKTYGSGSSSAKPATGASSAGPKPSSGTRAAAAPAPASTRPAASAAKPAPVPGGRSAAIDGGGSGSRKPEGKTFDYGAGSALRKQESKTAFQKAQAPQKAPAPRPSYTEARGQERAVDPVSPSVTHLRDRLDSERWVSRPARQQQYYAPYYERPAVVYNDPYSSLFWFWMLDQSLDRRAEWAYHHRHSMDTARYQEMLTRDAQLEARVRELEAKNVPRDPTHTPAGIDPDLMYTDEHVAAVYNPEPVVEAPEPSAGWGATVLAVLLAAAFLGFAVWLVFFKRWGGG